TSLGSRTARASTSGAFPMSSTSRRRRTESGSKVSTPKLSKSDKARARVRLGAQRASREGPAPAPDLDAATAAAGDSLTAAAKIGTGIPGLDKMLHGGFVPGRPYIVSGPPGAGKTILAMQFLREGLEG